MGIGILAKYTMILWIPSAGLFLLTTPSLRRLLFRPGFWIMTAMAAVVCLPILFWNLQHDWVSLRHVSGQAGFQGRHKILWLGPVEYIGIQFLVLLGFWFIAWAAAMIAHRPWRESDWGVRYLWWMSAPMFLVFLLFSLKTREEPNWPITAYVSGLVLASAWVHRQLQAASRARRCATFTGLATACTLGVFLIVLMHHSEWVREAPCGWRDHPRHNSRFRAGGLTPPAVCAAGRRWDASWTGFAMSCVLREPTRFSPRLPGMRRVKSPFTAVGTRRSIPWA